MAKPSGSGAEPDWRRQVVGAGRSVPLLDHRWAPYINLDNAASTPAHCYVRDKVDEFLEWYASIHRGFGFKSRLSTAVYEEARRQVAAFVGADAGPADDRVVIFCKHTTEAINKVAYRIPLQPGEVILTTMMEHHANLLPWRSRGPVDYVAVDDRGILDEAELDAKVERYHGRLRLLAMTGASNVTGLMPPISRIARKIHEAGGELLIDAAQLAPHRSIQMRPVDDPERIDYLVFSAHKMYAPFGAGVLIGPRRTFSEGEPDLRGGGAVKIVTLDRVEWRDPPDREESGSPNVVGVVALAAAIRALEQMGWDRLVQHERELTAYAWQRLSTVPGIVLYGPRPGEDNQERVGVISFNLEAVPPALVTAVLSYEFGIGLRDGCFCAHPYLLSLLGVDHGEAESIRARILQDDWSGVPGAVRASFGFYNDRSDVDALVEALAAIAAGTYRGRYRLDRCSGDYVPAGATDDFSRFFQL